MKRILVMAISLLLVSVLTIGGSIAYLTDTDHAENIMVVGNVNIEQIEMQRAEGVAHDGAAAEGNLVPFEQDQNLYPAVPVYEVDNPYGFDNPFNWAGFVTADVEEGETAKNHLYNDDSKLIGGLDKFVFVQNVGKSDAYYRTILAFECPEGMNFGTVADLALDDGDEKKPELLMNINEDGDYIVWEDMGYATMNNKEGVPTRYLLKAATYKNPLKPGETSRPSLLQVVMTHVATNEHMALLGDTYEILAFTEAVQVENMDVAYQKYLANQASGASTYSLRAAAGEEEETGVLCPAQLALTMAFYEIKENGEHPWQKGVNWSEPVATVAEFKDAIAEGKDVYLTEDLSLEDEPIVIKSGSDMTINLNGNTLSGVSTSDTTSKLIEVKAGSTLTLQNGTVSFYATKPDIEWGGEGQPPFPGYANNTISCSGTLVIDGATIENKTAKGGASYAIDCYPGADLIVNSGEVKGYDKVAIRMFCNSDKTPTNVTINGGEVSGTRAVWVQLPGSSSESVKLANLTVNGGVLRSTDSNYHMAIYCYSFGDSFSGTTIALNGGTYYGDVILGGSAGEWTGMEKLTVDKDNCKFYGKVDSLNEAARPTIPSINTPEDAVSTIDELEEAVKAGKPAVLVDDVNVTDKVITVSADTVLDLNGHALTGYNTTAGTTKLIEVKAGKTLTLKNGTVVSTGAHPDTDWGTEGFPTYATNTIACSGKLVIDGATIENRTTKGGASYAIDCYNGAELIVNSGKIIQSGGDVAIRMFGGTTNVTINGGEISGTRAIWLHVPGSDAKVAPDMNLTINGGTFTTTDTEGNNLAFYSYSYGNSFKNVDVVINGGTFNGDVCFGGGYKGDTENVTITGGTFNGYLGRYLDTAVNPEGWEDIAKPN